MSKRKAGEHLSTLGLGGYASDEEEEEEPADDEGAGIVTLLGSYGGDDVQSDVESKQEGDSADEMVDTDKPVSGTGELEGNPESSPESHVDGGDKDSNGKPHTSSLNHFQALPPEIRDPPQGQCKQELQDKFMKYVEIKRSRGTSVNEQLRKSKGYRNPDFLRQCQEHFGIIETGSNFPTAVFDPTGLPPEDFSEALVKQLETQVAKRQREQQEKGRIEFAKGGVQQPVPVQHGQRPTHVQDKTVATGAVGSRRSKWDNVPGR